MKKVLKYDNKSSSRKIYDLTDVEYQRLQQILTSSQRPVVVSFRGNLLKTSQMEVFMEDGVDFGSGDRQDWTDQELRDFEKYISLHGGGPEGYLLYTKAWQVTKYYPDGAVYKPDLYRKIWDMWGEVQLLRCRRESAQKHNKESIDSLAKQQFLKKI